MKHRYWIITICVVMALLYWESVFRQDFSNVHRFDLILAVMFAQTFGLIMLGLLLQSLVNDLRNQHRASTQIATLRGLWQTLKIGAMNGGMTLETRMRIYEAGEEAFETYDRIVRRKGESAIKVPNGVRTFRRVGSN